MSLPKSSCLIVSGKSSIMMCFTAVKKAMGTGNGQKPWVADADNLQAELARLKKENHRLKQERDILKKAAAFFASESGSGIE